MTFVIVLEKLIEFQHGYLGFQFKVQLYGFSFQLLYKKAILIRLNESIVYFQYSLGPIFIYFLSFWSARRLSFNWSVFPRVQSQCLLSVILLTTETGILWPFFREFKFYPASSRHSLKSCFSNHLIFLTALLLIPKS